MAVTSSGPAFRMSEIPFSYTGSWMDISPVVVEETYADDLHLVSHQTGMQPVLRSSRRPAEHGWMPPLRRSRGN